MAVAEEDGGGWSWNGGGFSSVRSARGMGCGASRRRGEGDAGPMILVGGGGWVGNGGRGAAHGRTAGDISQGPRRGQQPGRALWTKGARAGRRKREPRRKEGMRRSAPIKTGTHQVEKVHEIHWQLWPLHHAGARDRAPVTSMSAHRLTGACRHTEEEKGCRVSSPARCDGSPMRRSPKVLYSLTPLS